MSELDAYRKAHPDENEALDAEPRGARPPRGPQRRPPGSRGVGSVFIGRPPFRGNAGNLLEQLSVLIQP
jgi:hypothetical protein